MRDEAIDHQELESRYADKLELVFRAYERSLDLDIALTIVPLSDAERIRMIDDSDLGARIALCDARVREDLMTQLRGLASEAESEGVRLTALKELGKTLYPRRFKDAAVDNSGGGSRVVRYEIVEPQSC